MTRTVIWLVGDAVRLDDQPVLRAAAARAARDGARLLPLAVLDPVRWRGRQFGLPRAGEHWKRFRAQALADLRNALHRAGQVLRIVDETPATAVRVVREHLSVVAVYAEDAVSTEERLALAALHAVGPPPVAVEADTLFPAAALPFQLADLPPTFSRFRKVVERRPGVPVPEPRPPPELPGAPHGLPVSGDPASWLEARDAPLPPRAEVSTPGGESAGQAHWARYLASGAPGSYKRTRDRFEGTTASSHLSPWLAHGCLSPRRVWHDVLAWEREHGENESSYWLRFELLWREYFLWYARATDHTLFRASGPEDVLVGGDRDEARFAAWREGRTGCAVVDACLRELDATGWLSNRGRQLAASHLIHEAGLHWRLGAAWFEARLVDHAVGSNWGNWAYVAGVGADPRGGRRFDLRAQGDRHDPDGTYRRRWLGPEGSQPRPWKARM